MSDAKSRSRASTSKPPQYVTFTQQLDAKYWPGWDAGLISSHDVAAIGTEVIRRITDCGGDVTGCWMINHNRDNQADGTLKKPHVHGVIRLGAPNQKVEGKLFPSQLDAALGFDKSIFRAPGRGSRIANALSYLIHAKDPDKHRYEPDEVVTLAGQSYSEIEAEHRRSWGRAAVMKREKPVSQQEWMQLGDALLQRVLDGEIDELDLLRDQALTDIYSRNESRINLALGIVGRQKMMNEVQRLIDGEFEKTVLWFAGKSQMGKTFLVRRFVDELVRLTGWSVFDAASKNAADAYAGQEVMVFNEPSTRALDWADLLRLLGPRETGPLSARYKNKDAVAPRVVIFAVVVDPVEYGFYVPGKRSTGDSIDQLLLRIGKLVTAEKVGDTPHYWLQDIERGTARTYQIGERDKYGYLQSVNIETERHLTHRQLSVDDAVSVLLCEVALRSPGVIHEPIPGVLSVQARAAAASIGIEIAD